MLLGMYEQDLIAVALLGILANFFFSILFGWYLTQNIGDEEMMESRGNRRQSWAVGITLVIPYAKMVLTLYRVAILQLYFLNQGRTHKEFWIYLTRDESERL